MAFNKVAGEETPGERGDTDHWITRDVSGSSVNAWD